MVNYIEGVNIEIDKNFLLFKFINAGIYQFRDGLL